MSYRKVAEICDMNTKCHFGAQHIPHSFSPSMAMTPFTFIHFFIKYLLSSHRQYVNK